MTSNNTITSELSETFHGGGFMGNTLMGFLVGRGRVLMTSKDPRGRKIPIKILCLLKQRLFLLCIYPCSEFVTV